MSGLNPEPSSPPPSANITGADWLVGGGEMAKLIKTKDWSQTALGPIESWPQSLRTVVSLIQASSSPMSLAWGPGHVQIYNDGYWPICGDKHPEAMGQDYRECWAAPWPVIGDAYEAALRGKTGYLQGMRMFLDRLGFLEETWFTFSFSPITDESGNIGGLLHPVTELTGEMLSQRRTRTLRDLAARTGKAQTTAEVFTLSAQVLAASDLDLPFVLFYQMDAEGRRAQLAAQCGIPAGTEASPADIDLEAPAHWPIATVARGEGAIAIDDAAARLGGIRVGPYPEPPNSAFALPILVPGQEQPFAVMLAGVSSRLPMNEAYRSFYDLVVAAVSAALANARAYEEAQTKAEALAEIDRAKTAFFSNVSHEFRTPLTLMLGPLEDVLHDRAAGLSAANRERLDIVHRNGLRLLKLVNSLLDFSRIEAGRIQAQFEPTDLAALTADLASSFRSALERAGLKLRLECQALPQAIYVDREMWEKIVLNLLSNAFKHTFKGGVTVQLGWRENVAELCVEDTGIGIAAEELPKLFTRFHRVRNAQSRTHEGTGIGLSLVHELVRLHGGTVHIESQEGIGSRFFVRVPSGTAHLPADKIGGGAAPSFAGPATAAYVEEALHWLPDDSGEAGYEESVFTSDDAGGAQFNGVPEPAARPRILLADDNADMRRYVASLLSRSSDVISVADGEAALQAALAAPPDLILSDVMMPRLDGFGLLQALRTNGRTRAVPVILLSARAGEESSLEGLEAGADDYLVKPFSAKELLARVRSCLSLSRLRREAATNLESVNQALTLAIQAKSEFLARMSHEIRTPLNAVIGMAGLLDETPLDEQQRDFARTIRSSGEHLLTVINDILDFSKLESGKLMLEHMPFSLTEMVEETLDLVAGKAREKRLELAYELAPDVPQSVLGDSGRVRQVLLNYLSNAIKFTDSGEVVVSVTARPASKGVQPIDMTVKDSGIGIPHELRGQLFQSFSQVHASTQRTFGGTGLGLAICKQLAELMGGTVWVDSEPGTGSTFGFSFAAGVQEHSARVKWQDAQPSPLAGLRTWVVDDHSSNRRIFRRQCETWGMVVRDTAFPLEALDWARKGDACDLVLLDYHMPDMDGLRLASLLTGLRGERLKIVLLGSVEPLPTQEAQRAGINVQLQKPVKHSTLFNAIVKAFDLKAAARTSPDKRSALPAGLAQQHPLRILVAEDNAVNVKLITILLGRMGYRADVAGNGREAIEAVQRQTYDVILMDVQMPEMDGIEATRYINAEWTNGHRPRIVALTAGVMQEERQACLDAGMDEFLNKPVVPEQLVAALERCKRLTA